MHQTEVDHDAAAVTRFVQRLVQPTQIGHRAQHAHIASQGLYLIEYLHAAEQLRHRTQRLGRRPVAIRRKRVAQRCKGLVLDQTADAFRRLIVHAQFFNQRLINFRMTQFDAEIFRARSGQCAERRRKNILICFQPVCADQLRADLQKFPLVAVPAYDRAEHLLAVIQPHGQRRVVQTGRRNAGNRCGIIRPRHADAP